VTKRSRATARAAAPRRKPKTPALNLLVALAATLLPLLAIELYFRATYREEWYVEGDFPPGRYPRLNADGLRDVDYGPKLPGAYRILLIGDSFTFGSGVEDDAAIWPAHLERRLAELRPLPEVSAYEVLNGGIAGSLTDKWVALYRQQRELFRPDFVLVVFFVRDGTRMEPVADRLAAGSLARIHAEPLAQLSTTYRYFREKFLAIHFGRQLERFFVDSYVGSAEQTVEWQRAQANLLALRDGAAADGARFGLATFPMLYGLERDPYPFQPAMDALERFCRAHDIPHLSLLPAFRGRQSSDLWVSTANKHPNAEGHAIAAGALLPFVRELMTSPAGGSHPRADETQPSTARAANAARTSARSRRSAHWYPSTSARERMGRSVPAWNASAHARRFNLPLDVRSSVPGATIVTLATDRPTPRRTRRRTASATSAGGRQDSGLASATTCSSSVPARPGAENATTRPRRSPTTPAATVSMSDGA
jgi:hypothetical protein